MPRNPDATVRVDDLSQSVLDALQAIADTIAGGGGGGGAVDQGAAGAEAWPVTDAVVAAAIAALVGPAGLALEATQQRRYGGGKQAAVARLTTSGTHTVITPSAGQALRVWWVTAIANPAAATPPEITVTLGDPLYRAFAVAHWEPFDGAVDEPLTVSITTSEVVLVTVHYEEIP